MTKQMFCNRLEAIKSNRSSGAAELARKCLEIIADSAREDKSDSSSKLFRILDVQIELLARSRPSMAPVANMISTFKKDIKKFKHLPPVEARRKCIDAAGKAIADSIKSTEKTAKNTATFIGENKTVFTHSYSSTVLQTLSLLQDKNLNTIISESRPLCEGYILAEKLSHLKIPTTLITDAQTGLFVNKSDIVLVGADTILADFAVINKVGTYLLALAAYNNNIPFYVCGEKFKQVMSGPEIFELEAMDGAELNAPILPHVSIENIYFELTPAKLITGWINEEGIIPIPSYQNRQNQGIV